MPAAVNSHLCIHYLIHYHPAQEIASSIPDIIGRQFCRVSTFISSSTATFGSRYIAFLHEVRIPYRHQRPQFQLAPALWQIHDALEKLRRERAEAMESEFRPYLRFYVC